MPVALASKPDSPVQSDRSRHDGRSVGVGRRMYRRSAGWPWPAHAACREPSMHARHAEPSRQNHRRWRGDLSRSAASADLRINPVGVFPVGVFPADRATIFAGTSDIISAAPSFGSRFRHQYSRGALIWCSRANAAMVWPLRRHSSSAKRASSSVHSAGRSGSTVFRIQQGSPAVKAGRAADAASYGCDRANGHG
jgi:hypothetical protein